MKHLPEKERLLAAVLAEESGQEFREALLGQTLRLVKRRRRFRQVRRAAAAFALVFGTALLGWRYVPRLHTPVSNSVPSLSYMLVQTRPFTGIVSSHPLSSQAFVSSRPATSLITTREAHPAVPETKATQLLDMVRPSV